MWPGVLVIATHALLDTAPRTRAWLEPAPLPLVRDKIESPCDAAAGAQAQQENDPALASFQLRPPMIVPKGKQPLGEIASRNRWLAHHERCCPRPASDSTPAADS
jgi:hypothetical protein